MIDLRDRVDTYLLSEWDLNTLLLSTATTLRIAPGYALSITVISRGSIACADSEPPRFGGWFATATITAQSKHDRCAASPR